MKIISNARKSITTNLVALMFFVVTIQAVLFLAVVLLGGVISILEKDAMSSFSKKIFTRANYLEKSMNMQWNNISPCVDALTQNWQTLPDADANKNKNFLQNSAVSLIKLMRVTNSSGAFLVLTGQNQLLTTTDGMPGLYLRDYDPMQNKSSYNGLYMLFGPVEISRKLQISMEQFWQYNIDFQNEHNSAFLSVLQKSYNTQNGYWNKAYKLDGDNHQIITYTKALVDNEGKVFAILGVEIMVDYIKNILDNKESNSTEITYLIANKNKDNNNLESFAILEGKNIDYTTLGNIKIDNKDEFISTAKLDKDDEQLYITGKKLYVLDSEKNKHDQDWYIVGVIPQNSLYTFVDKTKNILWFSFVISLLIGIGVIYCAGFIFTKPITDLANQVRNNTGKTQLNLKKTGLLEIDGLAEEIEALNKSVLESVLKTSEIINMVDAPIAVFEYNKDKETVMATDLLAELLDIKEGYNSTTYGIIMDKAIFLEKLDLLLANPEQDEANVYKLIAGETKWLQIKIEENGNITFGVILDVTDNILTKDKIKNERDLDPLTQIYNRAAFERLTTAALADTDKLSLAAMVMFDLDNLKFVNDNYGHDVGDVYINTLVKNLTKEFSPYNAIIGRRSGDEFYIFLYGQNSKEQIRNSIEHFYHSLDGERIDVSDNTKLPVRASAGIAWCYNVDVEFGDLIKAADFAMYKAKHNCKGWFCETDNINNSDV